MINSFDLNITIMLEANSYKTSLLMKKMKFSSVKSEAW